jgi:hypothetical protein
MKFANLLWAITNDGRKHYRLAIAMGCSEVRFSRCLSGRSDFTLEEQREIAGVLGYSSEWLFRKTKAPIRLPRLTEPTEPESKRVV